MIEIITLIVGLVLCVLGLLMLAGLLNFIIDRYEGFHQAVRKKEFSVDKKGLAKFYAILYLWHILVETRNHLLALFLSNVQFDPLAP